MKILLTSLCFASVASAADIHLTPTGAGKKDGSNWDHALDQSALSKAVNETMKPGDRLLLGSGAYKDATLEITAGGKEGQPKTILGVDRGEGFPVFTGGWSIDQPTKGGTAVKIGPGVSHVTIQKLRVRGYTFCFHAPSKGEASRSHLVFDDVDLEQFRYGFYLADCDNVQLTGCDLKRYSKHGFRFDAGCDRVTLKQCTADCSEGDAVWEDKTELLPFGFTLNDGGAPNTAFLFEDCLARNNMKPNQTNRYKNGDGFVVEGNASDVTFVRCRAIRNQDAGYDLKVPDVKLTHTVAVENKRGFRIWTTGTLTNCFSGWGETNLWVNGGPVVANRCTFHAAGKAAVLTDDRATQPTTLNDCIISVLPGASAHRSTGKGKVILNETVVTGAKSAEKDPAFTRPDPSWDGLGDAMNSGAYPGKGYRSETVRSR